MIGIWVLIDLIATMSIAVGTSWFFTSRYLARRTRDHLGKNDVALLRDQAMVLNTLVTLDKMAGEAWSMPVEIRDECNALIRRYTSAKELPQ